MAGDAKARAPAEDTEPEDKVEPSAPAWTVERPTIEEAVYFLEIRAGEMMEQQHRLVAAGWRAKPDPEVMREAFVFRHLASEIRFKIFKNGKPQP